MTVAPVKVAKARKHYHTLIKIIKQNPGIHFRELLRVSDLGYGALQHQLIFKNVPTQIERKFCIY